MISGLGKTEIAEVTGISPKHQRIDNTISLFDDDVKGVQTTPHNDAVVVSMTIAKYDIKKYLLIMKVLLTYCSIQPFVCLILKLTSCDYCWR